MHVMNLPATLCFHIQKEPPLQDVLARQPREYLPISQKQIVAYQSEQKSTNNQTIKYIIIYHPTTTKQQAYPTKNNLSIQQLIRPFSYISCFSLRSHFNFNSTPNLHILFPFTDLCSNYICIR